LYAVGCGKNRPYVSVATHGAAGSTLQAITNHAEFSSDSGSRIFVHSRVYAPAIPTGFHGTQSATYLGNPTSDPYQTFTTCRTRDPLLYFGPVSILRFPVSPLGGDKGFSLTLNISLIFENIPDIFISPNRPRQGLEIPPKTSSFLLPVWG